ncbi:MAG: hypothetical protein OXE42_04245 [Gammaproteobacteria bacterium]|nr:hypothetical protein [Gammaproteobacteria bacterium]
MTNANRPPRRGAEAVFRHAGCLTGPATPVPGSHNRAGRAQVRLLVALFRIADYTAGFCQRGEHRAIDSVTHSGGMRMLRRQFWRRHAHTLRPGR